MLESYEGVSPTAVLTAFPRTFTDIPYSKEIYKWLNKNCKEEVILNELLAPELEARYKLIDRLIDKTNITQVLELASGYSSRGLVYSKKEYNYVEMDLEGVSNNKKRIINELFEMNDNLHIVSGNALNIDDYNKSDKYFDSNKELAIINEGLLRYLTFNEKKIVGQNIYNLLKKHGGVWITCDITPQKYIDIKNKMNISKKSGNSNDSSLRKNLNDRFQNEEQIKSFFGDIGFKNIEIHKFIEVKDELKSFELINADKEFFDELLDSGLVAIIRI